ncbi:hypothetical protein WJX72_006909 [[Myrmecia] bisecta]|uniref:C2H2-type domain-containing protein n=1 Tax=[Myrmecia] bisecta TaxID=41462 RepID=A0AAW1PT32_9CHLO
MGDSVWRYRCPAAGCTKTYASTSKLRSHIVKHVNAGELPQQPVNNRNEFLYASYRYAAGNAATAVGQAEDRDHPAKRTCHPARAAQWQEADTAALLESDKAQRDFVDAGFRAAGLQWASQAVRQAGDTLVRDGAILAAIISLARGWGLGDISNTPLQLFCFMAALLRCLPRSLSTLYEQELDIMTDRAHTTLLHGREATLLDTETARLPVVGTHLDVDEPDLYVDIECRRDASLSNSQAASAWSLSDDATGPLLNDMFAENSSAAPYGPGALARLLAKRLRPDLSAAEMAEAGVRLLFQPPGYMVVTPPGEVFHWTISLGFSVAEAANCFIQLPGGPTLQETVQLWEGHVKEAAVDRQAFALANPKQAKQLKPSWDSRMQNSSKVKDFMGL